VVLSLGEDCMNRRDLITLFGGAAAAWPIAARAQQAGKVWRIGFLFGPSYQRNPPQYAGFVQGMRELGYVEGKDFTSELRFAEGQYERFPDLAAELVQLKVDILFSGLSPGVHALQQATRTTPIVFASVTDPVGQGLVASLPHPGGNTTGIASSFDDTSPKQLELLAAVVPSPSRIGLLANPDNPGSSGYLKGAQDAARKAGFILVPLEARNLQDIENAFAAFGKERVQAVMLGADGFYFGQRQHIAQLALASSLPSICPQLEYAEAGGLLGYGEKLSEFYRRGAAFVDKILKGAKPADLPVEQPTRFHLVINRKTADALGLTIPPALYIFADEVIE
jgi:putative ABC transport system substrate-binding protein